jgi:hypothetical protein
MTHKYIPYALESLRPTLQVGCGVVTRTVQAVSCPEGPCQIVRGLRLDGSSIEHKESSKLESDFFFSGAAAGAVVGF